LGVAAGGAAVGRGVGRGVATAGVVGTGVGRGVAVWPGATGWVGFAVGPAGVGVGTTATTTSVGDGRLLGMLLGDGSRLGDGDGWGEPAAPVGSVVGGVLSRAAEGVATRLGGAVWVAPTPAMPSSDGRGEAIPTARANEARTRLSNPSATTSRAR
jgi:hypothetical protein